MDELFLKPNAFTYSALFTACASSKSLVHGEIVYRHMTKANLHVTTVVLNALLSMYCKCNVLSTALEAFWKSNLETRDVVTWTVMISGCVKHGKPELAKELYLKMLTTHTKPNAFTYTAVLAACAELKDIELGMSEAICLQFRKVSSSSIEVSHQFLACKKCNTGFLH